MSELAQVRLHVYANHCVHMAAQLLSIINVTVNVTVLPWSLLVVRQGEFTCVAH